MTFDESFFVFQNRVELMTIYGVSQSTGVERRLMVDKVTEGVVLTIIDHRGRKEQGRISLAADDLVAAVTDAAARTTPIKGLPSPNGVKWQLVVEVRRNEVWLTMSSDAGDATDIAVGFDDLQDALEGVISHA